VITPNSTGDIDFDVSIYMPLGAGVSVSVMISGIWVTGGGVSEIGLDDIVFFIYVNATKFMNRKKGSSR